MKFRNHKPDILCYYFQSLMTFKIWKGQVTNSRNKRINALQRLAADQLLDSKQEAGVLIHNLKPWKGCSRAVPLGCIISNFIWQNIEWPLLLMQSMLRDKMPRDCGRRAAHDLLSLCRRRHCPSKHHYIKAQWPNPKIVPLYAEHLHCFKICTPAPGTAGLVIYYLKDTLTT